MFNHYIFNTRQIFSAANAKLASPDFNASSKEEQPFNIPTIDVNPWSYSGSTPFPILPANAITGIEYFFAIDATPKGVLRGVIPALVTPLDKNGNLMEDALRLKHDCLLLDLPIFPKNNSESL